jgi:hypothetical protein
MFDAVAWPPWECPARSGCFVCMNAYLWHVDENLRHHMRAATVAEARERIAVTHGEETARRAVIRSLETDKAYKSESAAA